MFIFKECSLEALFHEDQVLSAESLGTRDEGGADGCQGFGNAESFGGREATLEKGSQAMKASRVGVGFVDRIIDG